MRFALIALALFPTTALAEEHAAPKPPAVRKVCRTLPQVAGERDQRQQQIQPRTLGNEPTASQYRPILRYDADGCELPVKIRSDVGRVQR